MKLYAQDYFQDMNGKKVPGTTTHYILPYFYKDRSLIIFRISKFRKNYFYSAPECLLSLGFKIWNNKMIELTIFGWEY